MLTVLLVLCAALAGCGAKTDDKATSSAEPISSSAPERPAESTAPADSTAAGSTVEESRLPEESSTQEDTTEAEKETSAESALTADMAYEGVSRYCRIELGFRPDDAAAFDTGLTFEGETEEAYQIRFRSYTGAVITFYVDKGSGVTRMEEYVPALDITSEAGSFDLADYLNREIPEESPQKQTGHYVFQPLVCSVYMEEVFGKAMCETWGHLVGAVMAGENTFACPDQHTYDWVMGQFPERCFPVLKDLIDYAWDRENSVKDGVASFTWKVSPEEAAARIAAFAAQIEGILNEALEDDYSDFEKVLALYLYFSDHYAYDYDMYGRTYTDPFAEVSSLRFFETGAGICQEIATAYSYLLMQAGVEATTMSGKRTFDNESHEWSYVRINGEDYHVDPTYVISDKGSLSYLMMTDTQRFAADGYDSASFYITSNYSRENPHPDYAATDETFAPLWRYAFVGFSAEKDQLSCFRYEEEGEYSEFTFDYSGY